MKEPEQYTEALEGATARVAERIDAIVRHDSCAPGEVAQALQKEVAEGRALIRAHHERGAGGRQVLCATSRLTDAVLGFLDGTFRERYRAAREAAGNECALVALGGYGRGELSPCSDVDIMFLWEGEASEEADYLAQQIVSILWDVGFQVGHSCRSIAQSLSLAESDTMAFTAMLDSRLLKGCEEVYASFREALRARLAAGGGREFVAAKLAERARRYRDHGGSISLLEPNVKESPGGLRDVQLVELVALADGGDTMERWKADGLVGDEQHQRIDVAVDFLHRVRNELHFRQGRKNDVLSMQIQPDVAEALGYRGDGKLLPVEVFMREYYTHAATIHQFSEIVLDLHQRGTMEAEARATREPLGEGVFRVGDELELGEAPSLLLARDPYLFLRLFAVSQREGLRLSRVAEQALRANLSLISPRLRQSRTARELFLEILSHERAAPVLRKMHEIGILGQYLPEFGVLTHLVRHDLYHHFTVDEHVLRAIEACEELAWTAARELTGLASLYRRLHLKWFLKLVLLCHDLGKSEKSDHVASSVLKARGIFRRWRLDPKLSSQMELLIANHLAMSQLAQQRDMHDEKLVESFAKAVGDAGTLDILYLITYADIQAVSPQSWTAWRGALLWELYHRTLRFLSRDQRDELSSEEFESTVREEVKLELADQVGEGAVDEYLHSMPYKYIVSTPVEQIAQHIKMVSALGERVVLLEYEHNFDVGYTELVVCTSGKPGVFSKIAGVLAARNINIIGADVYTTARGLAVDTFRVEGVDKNPVVDEQKWKRVEEDLGQVLSGGADVGTLVARGARFPPRPGALPFPPHVLVDNDISDTHTVIEVVAPDFLGLLFRLTEILFACGVDIYVARISTEADRAVDVFYVTDFEGNKITTRAKTEEIRERLTQFLSG